MSTPAPNKAAARPRLFLAIAGLIAYPLVTHVSIVTGYPASAVLALAMLVAMVRTNRSRRSQAIAFSAAAAGTVALVWIGGRHILWLLYAVPVSINMSLCLVFATSLLPGEMPVVTRYSRIMRGELPPAIADYTRKVTQAWAVFFAAMALECVVLAVYAPMPVWSLFANLLNYIAVGLAFAIEYFIRVRYLAQYPHPGFIGFLNSLIRIDLRHTAAVSSVDDG